MCFNLFKIDTYFLAFVSRRLTTMHVDPCGSGSDKNLAGKEKKMVPYKRNGDSAYFYGF